MSKMLPTSGIFTISTTTMNDQSEVDTIQLADGRLFSVWRSDGYYVGESVLRARFLNVDGTPSTVDFPVVSPDLTSIYGTSGFNPKAVQLGSGLILVAWTSKISDDSGDCVLGRLFRPNGQPLPSAEFLVNSTTKNHQFLNDVVKLEDGRALVTFNTYEDKAGALTPGSMLRGRVLDANGDPVGPDFAFDSLTDGVNIQKILILNDGGLMVIFTRDVEGSISLADRYEALRFDSAGDVVSSEITLNSRLTGSVGSLETTQLASGKIFFSWVSWENELPNQQIIRGRMMSPSGDFPSDDFDIDPIPLGSNGQGPTIQALANGHMFMTYTKFWISLDQYGWNEFHWAVFGVLLSETGAKIGNEFQISDPSMRDCYGSQITLLADGRVFVSWTTNDGMGDFSGTSVQGRYYFDNPYVKSIRADAGSTLQSQGASDSLYYRPVSDHHVDHDHHGVLNAFNWASADSFVFASATPVSAKADVAFAPVSDVSPEIIGLRYPERAASAHISHSSHAGPGEGPWVEEDNVAASPTPHSLHAAIASDHILML